MSRSDDRLVLGCLGGDRRAWESLVQRYARLLYGIARGYGLSEDEAADVFQTICLRLIQNLEKLRDDQHLTGWLITSTRHECAHVLRKKNRENTAEDSESFLLLAATDPSLDEAILRLEEGHMVRLAVEELDPRCRQLLELLYLEETPASYTEVSKKLSISVGGVGPTRARCLDRLRKKLLQMGF
jgi:RNA polymerase sigma factor (sigma-70 family)